MNTLVTALMILGVILYVGSLVTITYVLWMCRLPSGGIRAVDKRTLTDENYR